MKTYLFKNSISLFLCAVLILLSFSACGEKSTEPTSPTAASEATEATAAPEAPISAEGELDGGIKWVLQGGRLTLTGNGAMPDYIINEYNFDSVYPWPWADLKEQITAITVNEGITPPSVPRHF